MPFEHHSAPLLPARAFLGRMLKNLGLVTIVIGVSLGGGMLGYHYVARLGWVDALLNASMILSGMGPVNELRTTGAKLFASAYALFSGVVFLGSVGLLAAPLFHRFLHRFHLQVEGSPDDRG